jgi:hypothetical protein
MVSKKKVNHGYGQGVCVFTCSMLVKREGRDKGRRKEESSWHRTLAKTAKER